MAKVPLGLRLESDLVAAVDAARGDVPRARWIERAIEAALGARPERMAVATSTRSFVGESVEAKSARLTREARERRELREQNR